MTNTAADIALLTPVPLEHLVAGLVVVAKQGRVAFGSRAWELFRELDLKRHGMPVDVYIYASHTNESPRSEVSWHGLYIRHVDSVNGAHPEVMRYRPQSTTKYDNDNQGKWVIFYELEQLRELKPSERLLVGSLKGLGERRSYYQSFVPRGPLFIEHP
jgi:hypothetical protein